MPLPTSRQHTRSPLLRTSDSYPYMTQNLLWKFRENLEEMLTGLNYLS